MAKLRSFLKRIVPHLVFVSISLLVGILSALLTKGNMDIYDTVVTPKPQPPSALFPIVWTALYILMGIGAGELYKRRGMQQEATREGLFFFALQLIVNFLWSILFFNAMQYLLCVLVLIILLVLVILMTVKFYKVRPFTAILQIPYIVWLAFALYLNVGIVLLN